MIVAHILGIPLEESIGSIAPLVGVGGSVVAVQVSAIRRRLIRRRRSRAHVE